MPNQLETAQVIEGSEAVAHAVAACRPEVISAYPISPQTHIVENLAKFIADGELDSQYVRVEQEFSAASVIAGASTAGARAYTATASQGILLMTEVLYASVGQRTPFVITCANRSLSSPISIQIDQRDSMAVRDSGMIQLYCESSQEAYDLHLAAFKIAEDNDILLPTMVCLDGWVLTHSYEPVNFVDQAKVDAFLPAFKPPYMLDPDNPYTWGSYAESHIQLEINYTVQDALQRAKGKIRSVMAELSQLTGRDYTTGGGLVETYRCDDAETILIGLGSNCGTVKDGVDMLRDQGKKVGLIKIRCFRPFPHEDIWEAIKGAKGVAVLEGSFSYGSEGSIGLDLKAKVCNRPGAPMVVDFVAGVGGREVNKKTVAHIVERTEQVTASGQPLTESEWIDLDRSIL